MAFSRAPLQHVSAQQTPLREPTDPAKRVPNPGGTPEEIWKSLEMLRDGLTLEAVATATGYESVTVERWQKQFGALGSLDEVKFALNPDDTRYVRVIRELFSKKWYRGSRGFEWKREELTQIAKSLGIEVPKNLGDNIYAIRHGREDLPEEIRKLAPEGKAWLLLPNGKSGYKCFLAERAFVDPDPELVPIKIPDSTPQIVARNAQRDEQAVLARIRYCRLIDIFLGLASFQLQSHLRTTVAHFKGAQTELDELYVGVDGTGAQHAIAIQAKGDDERIGAVQLITDHYVCREKFPLMTPRTLAAKTVRTDDTPSGKLFTIALIEAAVTNSYDVRKVREQHYQLVPAGMIEDSELAAASARFAQR